MLMGGVRKIQPLDHLFAIRVNDRLIKELKELDTLGQSLMRILRGMTILTTFGRH